MLDDPSTPDDVRDFLLRVEDIRRFSRERLGLYETENFTDYVQTEKDHVAMVISACAEDSFERYQWWYPVFGSMPYRGFYVREDADFLHARLRRMGYDVVIRKVDAFSSLGFFKDPLFSFMVNYESGELADLIIHESAHATLFVKDEIQFNEEFATFVGRIGAELYLRDRYGNESQELAAYLGLRQESKIFADFLKETARRLEAIYRSIDLDRESRLAAKRRILAERKLDYAVLARNELRDGIYVNFEFGLVNNAYLDLYRLYEEDLSSYQEYLESATGGDLKEFIAAMVELCSSAGKPGFDIKDAMSHAVAQQSN
jgi:predicted aminopeptidase